MTRYLFPALICALAVIFAMAVPKMAAENAMIDAAYMEMNR